jgi:hypothetical protein
MSTSGFPSNVQSHMEGRERPKLFKSIGTPLLFTSEYPENPGDPSGPTIYENVDLAVQGARDQVPRTVAVPVRDGRRGAEADIDVRLRPGRANLQVRAAIE